MNTAQKSTVAAALALLASGWAGHAVGRAQARASRSSPPHSASEVSVTAVPDRHRPLASDPTADFESLLAGEHRRTWSVVSRLDARSVPVWLAKLRALQASTPRRSAEWDRLAEIESALLFHWADADPQSAWADVAAIPKSYDSGIQQHTETLVKSVLAAWMRRDPDEAYIAAKHHPEHGHTATDMLIFTWTPETLEDHLARHPDKRRDLLGAFAGSVATDAGKRETLLRHLLQDPAPKDADWGRKRLFRSWGYSDFAAAMARAEELELPDMVELIFRDNLSMSPQLVMPWAIAKGEVPGGPQWEEGYQDWLARDPAGARAWFGSQAAAWEQAGHDAAVAGFLSSEVAGALWPNSVGRADPAAEQAAIERLSDFLTRWHLKNPEAASRWRESAPKETRDQLSEIPSPP